MDKKKLRKNVVDIGKDILMAFTVVAIVMLLLFAYCGIWPPMVVVESGSMQRYNDRSVIGVIDTGDMVFVKKVGDASKLSTYADGVMSGYSRYGSYGDVIIYRPNGDETMVPIIHRLVVWLEVNDTLVSPNYNGIDYANYTFDAPSLGLYGTTDSILLNDYGFWKETVVINLGMDGGLMKYYELVGKVPHGGFITMGDHNVPLYDQPMWGSYEPVQPDWIVGKAIGEIPWFGLIKLKVSGTDVSKVPRNSWIDLFATLFILLLVPLLFDHFAPKIAQIRKRKKEERTEKSKQKPEKTGASLNGPPPTAQEIADTAPAAAEEDTEPAAAPLGQSVDSGKTP